MASTYLTRTISTSTNNTKFTISVWVKKLSQVASSYQNIINSRQSGTTSGLGLWFGNNDELFFNFGTSSTSSVSCQTNAKYRDNSAWYHIVVTGDASQSGTDKLKFWVNGEQITSFLTDNRSSFATIEYDLGDTTYPTIIGRKHDGTYQFDGLMAHFHFVDGTAYDASAFGQTDSTTGIWKPIVSPSVTYGTNGFFLKFANSGSMGADSSGNGNNFSVAAGTLTQTQDTPSNVFASINPNWKTYNAQPTFSNLNLTISPTTTAYQNHFSTLGVQGSGKWYAEMKCNGSPNSAMYYGVSSEAELDYLATNSNTIAHTGTYSYAIAMSSGDKRTNNSNSSYGSGFSNGDIMMFALDLDNSKVYFGKNGTWFNSGDPAAGTNPAFSDVLTNSFYFFGGTAYTNGFTSVDWNFGNGYFGTTAVSSANADGAGLGLFEYAPPTGFYSLCTKNINTYG